MRTALILRAVNMLGLPMVKVEENYELDRTLTLWTRCSASISLPPCYSTLLAGDNAESIGDNAESIGDNAESIGDNAESIGDNAESIGDNAESIGDNAESIGDNAESIGDNAESIGDNAESIGDNAESIGDNAESIGDNAESIGDNAETTGVNAESIEDNVKIAGDNAEAIRVNAKTTGYNAKDALDGAEVPLNGAEVPLNGAENTSLNKRYIRKQDSNNLMLQTLRESCELIAREISFEINLSLRRIRELLSESVKLGKIVTYGSNEKRNTCFPDSLSLYNAWKQCACGQVPTLPHILLFASVNADSYEIPNQKRCFLRRKEEWQR